MRNGRPTILVTWLAAIIAALIVFAVYQHNVTSQLNSQNHKLAAQQAKNCKYQHDATVALNRANTAIAHMADVAIHNLTLRIKADKNNAPVLKIDTQAIGLYQGLKDSVTTVTVPTCK